MVWQNDITNVSGEGRSMWDMSLISSRTLPSLKSRKVHSPAQDYVDPEVGTPSTLAISLPGCTLVLSAICKLRIMRINHRLCCMTLKRKLGAFCCDRRDASILGKRVPELALGVAVQSCTGVAKPLWVLLRADTCCRGNYMISLTEVYPCEPRCTLPSGRADG